MLCTSHLFFPLQVFGVAFSLLYICCCSATDTIMFNNSISDERGETLVSANGTFELGFFTPNESPSKENYVGIWYYNFTPQTVVWVANRDDPISDRNGSFTLTEDGKLTVLDGKGNVKWYTNFESDTSSNMTAKLEDSGNLVLIDEESGETRWESFKNPTDTSLPGMKMTESLRLTSWYSSNNPATGNFTFQHDLNDDNQYNVLQNGSIQHWKSGVSGKFIATDELTSEMINFLSGYTLQNTWNISTTFRGSYVDTRLVMSSSGKVQYYSKDDTKRYWLLIWEEPRDLCGVLNACGSNGICNSKYSLRCKCLPGFQPSSPNNWDTGDFSGGCKRKTQLCGDKNEKIHNFVSLKMMKVGKPDSQSEVKDEKECKDECVGSCDCRAYSYEEAQIASRGGGPARAKCWIWSTDLNNLWEEYAYGRNLCVRIARSDIDTIMFNNFISDKREETLVSTGKTFELGFFTPNESSSKSRYVGIWYYKLTQKTVVWVANRDNPLSDHNGSFGITEDGNLKVLDGKGNVVWSTDLELWPKTAKLMDSGNLVLSNITLSAAIVWESFKKPTDTFLPGMIMDENLKLISWKTSGDPAKGSFTFQKEEGTYDVSVQGGLMQYWTSETNQMPSSLVNLLSNNKYNYNKPYQQNFSYYNYSNTRVVMSFTGKIQFHRWDDNKNWSLIWWAPKDRCGALNFCGKFGICNFNNWWVCKCLPGFHPRSPYNWSSGHFSSGCIRKSKICGKIGEKETFLSLKLMKESEADKQFKVANETECRNEHCLRSCECQAYSYDDTTVPAMCRIWTEDLTNLQEEYTDEGRNIFVRVNVSDIEGSSKREMLMALIFAVTFALLIALIATIVYYSYIRKRNLAERQQNQALYLYDNERRVMNLIGTDQFTEEDKKDIDVPFFDLKSILVATDNFSDANKLGRGGFGPVYKAKFAGGQEIAVKRLSNVSGQGLEEFKNEVILIAKLQHRNLVRLLGYCIKGEEKILLYEYMPNKSLDSFIFDPTLSVLLDWELRFNIILGIARGLLYLHQDSRLRIIHRDLKTGNILLDEDMNPKISDFGLARIFEGKQTEANTNKVVGTYGYMSPEYANYGFFSTKSDVFSFGVVALEIISGKKVTGFYQFEQALSLLGYAWRLWNEDKALDMMDQTLCETCNADEFLKCVNIGLLCVQENPSDRPTMSNVVAMLDSKTVTLSIPKQPAFLVREDPSSIASSSSKPEACSNNELTVTEEGGR